MCKRDVHDKVVHEMPYVKECERAVCERDVRDKVVRQMLSCERSARELRKICMTKLCVKCCKGERVRESCV